jgi:hypothetical protein
MYVMLKIYLIVSSFLFSNIAQACLGPHSEDYVLLDNLPAKANERTIVAKIKLLVSKDRFATVRVIEGIKNVKVGQEFDLEVSPSSCSFLEGRIRFMHKEKKELGSDIYLLAGDWKQFKDKRVFVGGWRNGEFIAYPN